MLNAACLAGLALGLGMPAMAYPLATGLAMVIASGSFAARGALFAKTLGDRGWMMALFVVAGEASVLLIASVFPGVLPDWFLALLPAQWANIAIQGALMGTGSIAALPARSGRPCARLCRERQDRMSVSRRAAVSRVGAV